MDQCTVSIEEHHTWLVMRISQPHLGTYRIPLDNKFDCETIRQTIQRIAIDLCEWERFNSERMRNELAWRTNEKPHKIQKAGVQG